MKKWKAKLVQTIFGIITDHIKITEVISNNECMPEEGQRMDWPKRYGSNKNNKKKMRSLIWTILRMMMAHFKSIDGIILTDYTPEESQRKDWLKHCGSNKINKKNEN